MPMYRQVRGLVRNLYQSGGILQAVRTSERELSPINHSLMGVF